MKRKRAPNKGNPPIPDLPPPSALPPPRPSPPAAAREGGGEEGVGVGEEAAENEKIRDVPPSSAALCVVAADEEEVEVEVEGPGEGTLASETYPPSIPPPSPSPPWQSDAGLFPSEGGGEDEVLLTPLTDDTDGDVYPPLELLLFPPSHPPSLPPTPCSNRPRRNAHISSFIDAFSSSSLSTSPFNRFTSSSFAAKAACKFPTCCFCFSRCSWDAMRFLISRRCFFNSVGGRPLDSRAASAARSSASSLGWVVVEEGREEEEKEEEGVEAKALPTAWRLIDCG